MLERFEHLLERVSATSWPVAARAMRERSLDEALALVRGPAL